MHVFDHALHMTHVWHVSQQKPQEKLVVVDELLKVFRSYLGSIMTNHLSAGAAPLKQHVLQANACSHCPPNM
jgi:hypothetical protein